MEIRTGSQQAKRTRQEVLQERVNRLTERGMSPQSIERRLSRTGWGKEAIRAALKNATGKQTARKVRWGLGVGVLAVIGYIVYPWIAGLFGS